MTKRMVGGWRGYRFGTTISSSGGERVKNEGDFFLSFLETNQKFLLRIWEEEVVRRRSRNSKDNNSNNNNENNNSNTIMIIITKITAKKENERCVRRPFNPSHPIKNI